VSATKAGFDLRESAPLLRNILHSWEFTIPTDTEQRANPMVHLFLEDCRSWFRMRTNLPVSTGHLPYPVGARDTAESGRGHVANRHLPPLGESIAVNVGGSCQTAKASRPPRVGTSVGGFIVLGARESRAQGEGSQGVNASPVER
jgi:hypothetical protein